MICSNAWMSAGFLSALLMAAGFVSMAVFVLGGIAVVCERSTRRKAEEQRARSDTRLKKLAEAEDLTQAEGRKKLEVLMLRSQRMESIGMLAGGIAHDLNNVLTPILMAVKLLKKDRPESDRQRLLDIAAASVERGVEMVRHLLAFSGGSRGPRGAVDLKQILRDVRYLLEHAFPKFIAVHVRVVDDLWPVVGDMTQLSQVLVNLCLNARDAMSEGGDLIISARNVTMDNIYSPEHSPCVPGPYVVLSVEDTGTGIPTSIMDRIFDPFFTTKEPDKGTGLGLATSLKIVVGHGGFIDVDSQLGKGSRFDVYLPSQAVEQQRETREKRIPAREGRGEWVLVVDDEEAILLTAKEALEGHGYRAITVDRAEEAVAIYRERRQEIRAVVLGMLMPGMDGMATLRALRAFAPDARIIASSGMPTSEFRDDALSAGAQAFLQKPYSDEDLLSTLQEVLDAT